ncbi:histidine phosphatase family protein [Aquihabitans sp. G128]|uniref:histidine phosphatase family protein n=1 Tax=Aquihabitans sp. G128 TaxID=2849779 RepID=UPI001C24A77E|nr:histidine phosphatase family protein [Aquihabitans sp. G128]QXC62556.1 histidine phosphatase family protein [Aquihabitans sp. G128]
MTTTRLLIVRHGETDWARDRRHTGRTDIALNETGRAQAAALAGHLPLAGVSQVWSSPLARAADTARLAGLAVDRVDDDLLEWDYGAAEGRTTAELRAEHEGWDVWTNGVRMLGGGGEAVDEVGDRVDRVIARATAIPGTVALVAHAHLLRVLTARWLHQPAAFGRHLTLDPAGWAILAWERETPVIDRWNPPKP